MRNTASGSPSTSDGSVHLMDAVSYAISRCAGSHRANRADMQGTRRAVHCQSRANREQTPKRALAPPGWRGQAFLLRKSPNRTHTVSQKSPSKLEAATTLESAPSASETRGPPACRLSYPQRPASARTLVSKELEASAFDGAPCPRLAAFRRAPRSTLAPLIRRVSSHVS